MEQRNRILCQSVSAQIISIQEEVSEDSHLLKAELKVLEEGGEGSLVNRLEALVLESVGPGSASHLLEHASEGVYSLHTALRKHHISSVLMKL
jgi:hypothetical protein